MVDFEKGKQAGCPHLRKVGGVLNEIEARTGALLLAVLACGVSPSQTGDAAIQARLAKHAALFTYRTSPGWPRLESLKPDSDGIIRTQRVTIADYMARSSKDIRTKESELAKQAKRADAVISGTISRRYSAIDPTHTFLYSDWIVAVGRVYKSSSTVQVGSEIVVTREGGDLILDGQRIIDADPLFPEFILNRKYVFLLRALPDTASFSRGWGMDVRYNGNDVF
jgi:hypothetical protein